MLHVNDNTDDEMFRKAADDYFLEANKADWETLQNKINNGAMPTTPAGIQKNKKRFALSFLFSWFPGKKSMTRIASIFPLFSIAAREAKIKKKIDADAGLIRFNPRPIIAY